MKTFFLIFCLLVLVISARAGIVTTNLVFPTAVATASTNYGSPVLIGSIYIPNAPSFIFSSYTNLAGTNALTGLVMYGFSTNINSLTTVGTYSQATTNPTDGTVSLNGITIPVYAYAVIVTTTNTTVGSKAAFTTP